MSIPQYIAVGGPRRRFVLDNLGAALAKPGYSGVSCGIDAADCLAGNFADLDALLALLQPSQDLHLAVTVTQTAGTGYQTIAAMDDLTTHGGQAKQITFIPWFDQLAIDDLVEACQDAIDHLDIIGQALPRSLSITGIGSATCEARLWSGGPKNPQTAAWEAAYPGQDIPTLAKAGLVQIAQRLSPLVPELVGTFLDPGTLAFGGAHDDGAFAAETMAIVRASVSVPVSIKYESLESGRPVPPVYALIGGPIAYQAKEGALISDWPADAAWGEQHIRDVVTRAA